MHDGLNYGVKLGIIGTISTSGTGKLLDVIGNGTTLLTKNGTNANFWSIAMQFKKKWEVGEH